MAPKLVDVPLGAPGAAGNPHRFTAGGVREREREQPEQREAPLALRQGVQEVGLLCKSPPREEVFHSLLQQRRATGFSLSLSLVAVQNNSNPGQDLVRTPPGLLALDTMFYFAKRYPDAYSRVSASAGLEPVGTSFFLDSFM